MKLCIDCDHYLSRNLCARKAQQVFSPVTGQYQIKGPLLDCFVERRPRWVDSCNKEAKYFVPQKQATPPPAGTSSVMKPIL